MKRKKKQYRPIAGQTWYEKVLDWITRKENCRWSAIGIWIYVAFLLLGVYISANLLNQPDIADIVLRVWFRIFPVVVVVAAINPLSGIWGLRAEGKLQKTIKDCVETYGRCTYDELVAQCMPIRIHLGIDSAIEKCSNVMSLYGRMAVIACLRMKTETNGGNNGLRNTV